MVEITAYVILGFIVLLFVGLLTCFLAQSIRKCCCCCYAKRLTVQEVNDLIARGSWNREPDNAVGVLQMDRNFNGRWHGPSEEARVQEMELTLYTIHEDDEELCESEEDVNENLFPRAPTAVIRN